MSPDLASVGLGALITQGVAKVFRWNKKAFPTCHTQPMREGRGWPWDRQVLVHTQEDGTMEMKFVQPDESTDSE